MNRPLISDGSLDVLASIALIVVGTPIWLAWRGWRYLRTGG